MFGFLHRSAPRSPSSAIRKALDKDGLPMGIRSASMLRVVQSHGRYSDRKVTYIRVFDPVRATERHVNVRDFSDLDAYPGLILKAGHIEPDGIVVITRRWPVPGDEPAIHTSARQVTLSGDRASVREGSRAKLGASSPGGAS